MQVRREFQRWRADAEYRHLFREQRWGQRRQRLRWEVRRRRNQLGARSTRRAAVATAVVLLAGVVGFAAIRVAGDAGVRPAAEGTARPAADHSSPDDRRGRDSGAVRPGIMLSAAVDDFGVMEVAEVAHARQPLLHLSLAPPPTQAGTDGTPRLEGVQVSADGQPVSVPDTIAEPTQITLAEPATTIELRYRVVGAAARSVPAPPGRATLSLRPALASTLVGTRAVVRVNGAEVHNLVCVDRVPEERLCGIDRGDGWRTQRLPTASSAVVALVDLPDPAA